MKTDSTVLVKGIKDDRMSKRTFATTIFAILTATASANAAPKANQLPVTVDIQFEDMDLMPANPSMSCKDVERSFTCVALMNDVTGKFQMSCSVTLPISKDWQFCTISVTDEMKWSLPWKDSNTCKSYAYTASIRGKAIGEERIAVQNVFDVCYYTILTKLDL